MIQVDVGDQANSKLISISKSLSPKENQDLICPIWEYIDVFACSYEGIPSLDTQVVMHYLNIKSDAKLVKQQQRWVCPNIMEAIQTKVYKLIECGFIQEEQ